MKRTITFILLVLTMATSFAAGRKLDPDPLFNEYPVYNGCHIESRYFVMKYKAANPLEQARVEVVMMSKYQAHTVALFTYKGFWYVRDFVVGCIKSDIPANHEATAEKIAPLMIAIYRDNKISPNWRVKCPEKPRGEKDNDKWIKRAGELVPEAKTYKVTLSDKYLFKTHVWSRNVLMWREDGKVFVFHPEFGTLIPHGRFEKIDDDNEAIKEIVNAFGWNATKVEVQS